jgi:hypothetical protein
VAHVLIVAAGEFGDPVAEFIQVKICNRLIQEPGFPVMFLARIFVAARQRERPS